MSRRVGDLILIFPMPIAQAEDPANLSIVSTATATRDVTTTRDFTSTYQTTLPASTITTTYQTVLPGEVITQTYRTTIPPSTIVTTQVLTSTQPAVTVVYTLPASTLVTTQFGTETFSTTIPASTVTTTQPASFITTTFLSTIPASTIVTTSVSQAPQRTVTLFGTTTAPPVTATVTSISVRPASTVTRTVDALVSAPPLCGNQGVQYAVVSNNQPSHTGTQSIYTLYNPAYLKAPTEAAKESQTPVQTYYTGVAANVPGYSNGCTSGQAISLYGSSGTASCQRFSTNHRGYFWPRSDGNWTFSVTGADDAVLFWGGPKAQSGWTKANADFQTYFRYVGSTQDPNPAFATFNLTAGTWFPYRLVHGQSVGGMGFRLTVSDRDGVVYETATAPGSSYFVQWSCDGRVAAPDWPAWGSET